MLLVSDAAGQTAIDKDPGRDRIGVSLRTNNVLLARGRQEQYQLLSTLVDAGLLRGVAYVHLKKDLDAEPVDWLGCPDPSTPEPKNILTTYGIRKDVQKSLAAIRTDLDSFSDAEADALMLSGYQMMKMEVESCIKGFPGVTADPVNWRFRAIEKLAASLVSSPDLQLLQATLDIAQYQAFKPYRLSKGVRALTWVAALVAVASVIWLMYSARGETVKLMWLLTIGAAIAGIAIVVKLLLRHVLRNPNPLWQCILAVSMIVLGAPLIWIMTRWLDPIYLRSGPRYRS